MLGSSYLAAGLTWSLDFLVRVRKSVDDMHFNDLENSNVTICTGNRLV